MPAGNPHIGDVNTNFVLTMKDNNNGTLSIINLANFNTLQIEFQNEVVKSIIKTATVFTTPGAGQIVYSNTDAGFLNQAGTWRMRGVISDTITKAKFTGTWYEFEVSQ